MTKSRRQTEGDNMWMYGDDTTMQISKQTAANAGLIFKIMFKKQVSKGDSLVSDDRQEGSFPL